MDRWKGQVAVVVGASAGIGAVVAELLVNAGLKVVGIARHKEGLQKLAKNLNEKDGQFYFVTADVTVKDDLQKAFKNIKKNVGLVSILVNSVGATTTTTIISGNPKFWQNILNSNVLALCIGNFENVTNNNKDEHVLDSNNNTAVTLAKALRSELDKIKSKIKISNHTTKKSQLFKTNSQAEESKENSTALALPFLNARDIAKAINYILGAQSQVEIQGLIVKPAGEN